MTTRLDSLFTISIYECFGHHGQWDTVKSATNFLEVKDYIVLELADWLRHSDCEFTSIDTAMGIEVSEQEQISINGRTFIEKEPRNITSLHPNLLKDIYIEADEIYQEREAQRISDEKILEMGKKRALLERLKKELENA